MEERELTVEDALPRLRDYCKPLVEYDKWWDETAIVRKKFDRLMREIKHLLLHYQYCFKEPRYPRRVCKRLRRRLEAHVKGAQKLLARVEELIKEGESLEVRRRNFEHLMWRLSWMRNNLTRAIEEASKLLAKEAVSQDAQG